MNVLKQQQRIDLEALLRAGYGYREIERRLGIRRETASRYAEIFGIQISKPAKHKGVATGSEGKTGQNPPTRPPAGGAANEKKIPVHAVSACEPHREWIQAQLALGRNAQAIYQDMVEQFLFMHKYNSVKRFCRSLKAREPERFDVLEFLPGEEAQVDYGQGALTLYKQDQYKRPYLFVMTLKYSGKSFRKVVSKTDQGTWARLHEEAFRAFGGCPQYVVLDNLKEGVIRPDVFAPEINRVYGLMLAHYGVVADPCRVRDPNRKGTVESAIQHTQSTALKGRKFDSIDAQNQWLAHWEEKWAAPRIHGRKRRQVIEMYLEEKPYLRALPSEGFHYFTEHTRTVDDSGLVRAENSFYAALPAALGSEVRVRVYDREIVITDNDGLVLRRHKKSDRAGKFEIEERDRIFNPSRETTRLIERIEKIGPSAAEVARRIFSTLGRPGQRAIYGLAGLTRHHKREAIESVCERLLNAGTRVSYQMVKAALNRSAAATTTPHFVQSGVGVRSIDEYKSFWEMNSQTENHEEEIDGNDYH